MPKKETGVDFTVTAIVFPFHRAGYCNSTALVEAKPRAIILSYMSFLPSTFLFPSRRIDRGLNNTVLRFAKCLIQSSQHHLRTKMIRIKKERCVATLGPHSIMPYSVAPSIVLRFSHLVHPPSRFLAFLFDNLFI